MKYSTHVHEKIFFTKRDKVLRKYVNKYVRPLHMKTFNSMCTV